MVRLTRLSFVMVLSLLWLAGIAAETVNLTILHTNDTHGRLLPFSYPSLTGEGSPINDLKSRTNIGGIARRATLMDRIEAELVPQGYVVWRMDAGDIHDGTAFSLEYNAEADITAMNAAGYDFMVFGNHEFNNTLAQVKKLIEMAQFKLVGANVIENSTQKPLFPPYTIENAKGVRVGIFGITTESTRTYRAAREGLTIADEVETARKMVAELRPKVDVLIMLSHIGLDDDRRIAREVPGIDVIVGGHSHTRLPVGEFHWFDDKLFSDRINGTIIAQAFQWGGELGRLDLLLAKDSEGKWRVERYRSRLLPIDNTLQEKPEVAAVVERFWKPIQAKYAEVIGRATMDFTRRGDDNAEYHLVADSVREAMGTEVHFENMGGVRAPILKGPITMEQMAALDPFGNTIVTFEATGKQIREIVERHRPVPSGLRYRVEDGKVVSITVNGKPLEENRVYKGSTNSFFAGRALTGIQSTDTKKARLQTVIDAIKKANEISPAYDGRRVLIGSGDIY